MATKTPKPVADLSERCDGANARGKWLGIARLTRIPDAGFLVREACQAIVTSDEKAAGIRIVEEYRQQEQLAEQHDVDRRQMGRGAALNLSNQHAIHSKLRFFVATKPRYKTNHQLVMKYANILRRGKHTHSG